MRFDIFTLFPHMFDSYFSESILKRAQISGRVAIFTHDIREFATDKHKTTDDIPYGGGAGMILKVQPIFDAVHSLKNDKRQRIILFSAKGKQFTQRDAERLAGYERLIFICGRYEGVDERVAQYIADEEISVGPYVLTGGEVPAMMVVDSVTRLLPGVLGNKESLREESFSDNEKLKRENEKWEEEDKKERRDAKNTCKDAENILEYPQYTRPEEFNGWRVPEVLLSGNHAEILKWKEGRRGKSKRIEK